jgi:transposase
MEPYGAGTAHGRVALSPASGDNATFTDEGGRRMRRHELSDEEWVLIKPLLPKQGRGGRWNDHRAMLSAMMWILRTGAPWRDLPERFDKWKSVYDRFNRWQKDGTFDRILKALRIRLDKEGKIDWDLWCIDGTSGRASRSAAGASKKRAKQSRKTTRWAAREAGGAASSTWLLTARAFPSPPASRPGKRTNRRSSSG